MKRTFVIGAAVGVIGGLAVWLSASDDPAPAPVVAVSDRPAPDAIVQITVPPISPEAQIGARIFAAECADCHGENAVGRDGKGPPLVHKIYEPGHHGDIAFLLAAQYGVKSHHWRFGDMPPVEQISPAEMGEVIVYIRELQRANGIQ